MKLLEVGVIVCSDMTSNSGLQSKSRDDIYVNFSGSNEWIT
jgi:hypothetical protein